MLNKMVTLRSFPSKEGDTTVQVAISDLTREQVFIPGTMVVLSGVRYTDWDKLLQDLQKTDNAVVEQFKPMAGG
jgi:hypothetical protein